MLKILHVVHDDKFIDSHLERYSSSEIENEIIYLGHNFTYKGVFSNVIKWVKPFSEEFDELIKDAKRFDLVIVYLLNHSKALFVNKIDKSIPVIWHFFGGEIYHAYKYKNDYYGPATKKILNADSDFVWKAKILIKELRAKVSELLTNKKQESAEFFKAIKRVNYFLWFDQNEYELIKEKIPYMPEFLPLTINSKVPEISLDEKKEAKVLVGNSNVPANNHYDLLLLLEESGYSGSVLLPCSYGIGRNYFLNLKSEVKKISLSVKYLEDFMPYQEYIQMIATCSAALFNSYRQMALGNILIFLTNGVKVYLSEKNPSLKWFKNQGFFIYSIEHDLKADIQNNNLVMLKEHSLLNREKYKNLTKSIHKEEFLTKLTSIAKKNKVAVDS